VKTVNSLTSAAVESIPPKKKKAAVESNGCPYGITDEWLPFITTEGLSGRETLYIQVYIYVDRCILAEIS
jgi:hypothetical protein